MVYVLVSTFAPPTKLKEMIESSGKRYYEIDVVSETVTNQDDIISALSDVFTLPGKLVKKVLSENDADIIYVKNDGTLDDEVISSLIKDYIAMIKNTITNLDDIVEIPTIRVVTIKNKLTLIKILSTLETNRIDEEIQNNIVPTKSNEIKKGDQETEIESVLEDDEDLYVTIEEYETKDENTKLFVITVEDEDGNPVSNKVVELTIISGEGVFASNGATSTRVKVDEKGNARVKVLVPDKDTDIDFNYEIVE